jgi:uncharacterized protein (DUF433 family)
MEAVIREHIEATLGVCGGKPRIAGRRIRVMDVVVWHEQLGLSPDEIVSRHPDLTLADIHAALAYYFDHRDEIQKDIASEREFAEKMRRETPSLLRQTLGSAGDR